SHDVQVSEDIPTRLMDLDGVDMVVVNAAAGPSGGARGPARRGLDGFIARGGAVLAVHVGVCSLLDLPSWSAITGAAWVSGRSMHPPLGPCRVDVRRQAHPIAAALESFDVVDERYAHLDLTGGRTVVATHR